MRIYTNRRLIESTVLCLNRLSTTDKMLTEAEINKALLLPVKVKIIKERDGCIQIVHTLDVRMGIFCKTKYVYCVWRDAITNKVLRHEMSEWRTTEIF